MRRSYANVQEGEKKVHFFAHLNNNPLLPELVTEYEKKNYESVEKKRVVKSTASEFIGCK